MATGVNEGLVMSGEQTSTLTVAKLKALCILNDLSTSGKKSDLVERLLDFGLSNKEVGLPVKETPITETKVKDVPAPESKSEIVLSMEDEETITPSETVEVPEETSASSDENVLEAEVLDAEILEEEPVKTVKKVQPKGSKKPGRESPATLLDIVRKPQVAAVLLTVIILGAGGSV